MHLLGSYLGRSARDVPIAIQELGKLSLAPGGNPQLVQFNLSHSGKWIVLALARERQVGIDIERIRPLEDLDRMAAICCSSRELALLRTLPASEKLPAFFGCWVRKEAYVKGLGQGMRMPLHTLEVSFAPEQPSRAERSWHGDGPREWFLQEIEMGPDYAGA